VDDLQAAVNRAAHPVSSMVAFKTFGIRLEDLTSHRRFGLVCHKIGIHLWHPG
jgi:hypothetical protein